MSADEWAEIRDDVAYRQEIAHLDVRVYIDSDGCVSEPIGEWADGSDHLPNHHNNWHRVWPNHEVKLLARIAELEAEVERLRDYLPHSEDDTTGRCFCGADWVCPEWAFRVGDDLAREARYEEASRERDEARARLAAVLAQCDRMEAESDQPWVRAITAEFRRAAGGDA